ncbi:hypothetical protein BP6252_13986 [Coleophoma cylindrospora]|uniref:Zn(2)-C6 fungal-type domain-containing protein n=1 Tax=Coleophoma cylindrospora TaxID=1849047 RepID=A0A3D8Q4H4_9HELO|nr:hypothetical protein BP6252_13986 [Coleophoma cylindrospora]
MSTGQGPSSRASKACEACREKKVKCSGDQPCHYCVRRRLNCTFPRNGRNKVYPVSQVEELRRRVAFYEQREALAGRANIGIDTSTAPKPRNQNQNLSSSSQQPQLTLEETAAAKSLYDLNRDLNNPTGVASRPINEYHTVSADAFLSSSQAFETEVQSLWKASAWSTSAEAPTAIHSEDSYGLSQRSSNTMPPNPSHIWPLEEDAYKLLDLVLFYLGQSQHFFDPRTFSDKLSLLYENIHNATQIDNLSLVEILLVLALGKLIQGQSSVEKDLPGADFYLEAMKRVPDLCTLRSSSVLGVEIMGLSALYLQSSDCKEDAYVIAGTAMRLAVSQRLYRKSGGKRYKRSEIVHRNRLWWSIYMQERRLAAATGHPWSISDEAIDADMPLDAPGYCSSLPLNVNVRIAQVTGQIISTVYGTQCLSQQVFTSKIQGLLSTLYEVARTMPHEYELQLSQNPLQARRTASSLYLMLFQAIILTIRPVLLHLAKTKLEVDPRQSVESAAPPIHNLHKLADTCVVAAKRSLNILEALLSQGILGKFGFFDQDAAFSVAFVLTLAKTISPADNTIANDVERALLVMKYFADNGHKSAAARLVAISQIWSKQSEPSHESSQDGFNSNREPDPGAAPLASSPLELSRSNVPTYSTFVERENNTFLGPVSNTQVSVHANSPELQFDHPTQETCGGLRKPTDKPDIDFMAAPLLEQDDNLYNIYHDSSLLLTGVDFGDWEEFDRHITWPR